MKLDKTKLQEVVEKIAYQQTSESQAEDLFNKMGILNEYIKEQLAISNTRCCTELKAIEDLKDFAYNNCQLHNTDQLDEIIERL